MALSVTEATVGRERWGQLAGRGGIENRDTARACQHQGLFAFPGFHLIRAQLRCERQNREIKTRQQD